MFLHSNSYDLFSPLFDRERGNDFIEPSSTSTFSPSTWVSASPKPQQKFSTASCPETSSCWMVIPCVTFFGRWVSEKVTSRKGYRVTARGTKGHELNHLAYVCHKVSKQRGSCLWLTVVSSPFDNICCVKLDHIPAKDLILNPLSSRDKNPSIEMHHF